eukprot:1239434-Pyramimonas_sp.AAC.1
MAFGEILDYEGAAVTLIRGVEVAGMAFWHDSGSSKHNRQVHLWRWSPENHVLACFRVLKRLSSNEALPSV